MLKWTPSERASRRYFSRRFKDLKAELGVLKKAGELGDERKEKARNYVSVLARLVAFNDEAIRRVEAYVSEKGVPLLEEQLENHRVLYEQAGHGFRGQTGANFRHWRRLVRFSCLSDIGELTLSQLRRRKVYLARKLLDPLRVQRGRPGNLVRVTKDGQRLPTCAEQYIRVGGEWYRVVWLPRVRGGHYHCERIFSDPAEEFSGQKLNDVLAEEIDEVTTRHPFIHYLNSDAGRRFDDESENQGDLLPISLLDADPVSY